VGSSETRQVVVDATGSIEIEVVAAPEAGAGEAVVRLLVCGICGSDVHAMHGRHPWVKRPYHPGHEIVGVVESVGEGVVVAVGTRVAVEPILACGSCKRCRGGEYNLCRTMAFFGCTTPLGGMADRFVIAADRLIPLPAGLSDLDAALVEPLSTPVHAVRLAGGDLTGKSVAILGAGTIGLLVLAAARNANAQRIAVSEPLQAKRDLARRLGADAVFDATDPGTIQAVRDDLGESADVVFDCVGIQSTMDQAIAMAVKGGTVVVVGVPSVPVTVPLPEVQDLQIRIQGSATYVRDDILAAISMLERGLARAGDLVTAVYPLDDAAEAFAAASSGRHVKVVITTDPALIGGDAHR
jgi:2-desacetyl-2-hydroxyethyl bacteriochlorophyllide A dehydrogenase